MNVELMLSFRNRRRHQRTGWKPRPTTTKKGTK
ncbi:hypothetical protein [Mycobacterium phage PP]|uniref:Uncharacterized protein n=1 Tax=Mycobacterium phage PP TaxID=2077134 RepID=A0A2Z5XVB1_9CAUD|nr:hypothetical protein KIW36_gp05 [Mycobacterium phage PP]BBC53799.1 hypothetical protein [Mycobacterium phage PP]